MFSKESPLLSVPLFVHVEDVPEYSEYQTWCDCRAASHPPRVDVFSLWLDVNGLALLAPGFNKPYRLSADVLLNRTQSRPEIAKACGIERNSPLRVFDAFAGFGIDGLTLASVGAHICMVEQQRLVWLLLRDFARRCGVADQQVLCGDGLAMLAGAAEIWDVVYLDPMFDPRRKRALPNRGLQHLREMAQASSYDAEQCLEIARRYARQRVVLKRRLRDPVIQRPSFQVRGHSIRFDVYL